MAVVPFRVCKKGTGHVRHPYGAVAGFVGICRLTFEDRSAFAHVFDDGAADSYLGGVRSTVRQAFVSEAWMPLIC